MSGAGVGVSVLCPGDLRTSDLFESQRNLGARKPSATRPLVRLVTARANGTAGARRLDIAMAPAEVAGMVHDAVVEDRPR